MQDLCRPKAYPTETIRAIESLGALGVEIANRWMLGWPKRVRGLLATGEYLEALKAQHEEETLMLARENEVRHLARHEIAEIYGLSAAPPEPTPPTKPD